MDGEHYLRIGNVLGIIVGVLTFLGCWGFCIASYGFLIGVGLGWFPSGIVAAIAYAATVFLWGPAAAIIAITVFMVMRPAKHTDSTDAAATAAADTAAAAAATATDAAVEATRAAADTAPPTQTSGHWVVDEAASTPATPETREEATAQAVDADMGAGAR